MLRRVFPLLKRPDVEFMLECASFILFCAALLHWVAQAVYDINEHNHFLFSTGRGLENASDTNVFSWYAGYLITGP